MDQALELDVLQEFLNSRKVLWLQDTTSTEDPSTGIPFVRACGALYRSARQEFPNLALTPGVLDRLCEAKRAIPEPPGGYWDTDERGRGEWEPLPAVIVSTAMLARSGDVEDVLVTAALSSHDYDYYGGQGQAQADGYAQLIPAIVSSLAAPMLIDNPTLDVPPWFTRDGARRQIGIDPLSLALSQALSVDARSRLLFRGDAEPGVLLSTGDEFDLGEGLWLEDLSLATDDFIIAASDLGIDLTPYFDPEDVKEILDEWQESLRDPEDPDVEDQLRACYLAVLVNRYDSELNTTYLAMTREERDHRYPWLWDWTPWQLIGEGLWPPSLDAIRHANAENH